MKRCLPYLSYGLLVLPIAGAWLFVPQLANAFQIKYHLVVLGSLGLALFLVSCGQRSIALPKGWIGYAFIVWGLSVLASSFAAGNHMLAMHTLLLVFACVLLMIFSYNLTDLSVAQDRLETGLIIAGLGVAVFALKQHFLPNLLDPGFHALGKMKIYATLGNANLAGLVILAALPSAARRILNQSGIRRGIYAVGTLILLGGLVTTQARHAMLALLVMVLVAIFWLGSPKVRRAIGIVLLASGGIFLGVIIFWDLPPALMHTVKGRWFIWLTALEMLRENPIVGVGPGLFAIEHMRYQATLFDSASFAGFFDNAGVISEAHNEFLHWGASSGLFGLIGFTSLCAGILWRGWHSADLKQHAPQLYVAWVGYLVAMFFIALTSYAATALLFWLITGMVLVRSNSPRLFIAWPGAGRYLAAALLTTLLIISVRSAWREARAGWYEASADKLMVEHDVWLAERAYRRAVIWNPYNGKLRKKYATTLFLRGQPDQAVAELRLAKQYSGDLGIYLLEGEILIRSGNLDPAQRVYEKISRAFPNMVGPHFILGQIYQLQGKRQLAEREFTKVLAIRPSPYNLNMTVEKVEMQKKIVRDYLSMPR